MAYAARIRRRMPRKVAVTSRGPRHRGLYAPQPGGQCPGRDRTPPAPRWACGLVVRADGVGERGWGWPAPRWACGLVVRADGVGERGWGWPAPRWACGLVVRADGAVSVDGAGPRRACEAGGCERHHPPNHKTEPSAAHVRTTRPSRAQRMSGPQDRAERSACPDHGVEPSAAHVPNHKTEPSAAHVPDHGVEPTAAHVPTRDRPDPPDRHDRAGRSEGRHRAGRITASGMPPPGWTAAARSRGTRG